MHNLLRIECIHPGLMTTIQDQGRSGQQHVGIPPGGALDGLSARIANTLVGNPTSHPVLEITVIGPQLKFHNDCQIALTGARIPVLADGHSVPFYQTINLPAGTILRLGQVINGCRTYLAVGGAWKVDQWLGSSSALTSTRQEHTPFAYLKSKSILNIELRESIQPVSIPSLWWPDYTHFPPIRLMPGPEFFSVDHRSLDLLLSQSHIVSRDSNRMGYRLKSRIQFSETSREILSSAILPGTIQITSSGQPILLLADAQTTGGYFRVGQVIGADIDLLGQLKPGDEIGFVMVTSHAALKAGDEYLNREALIMASIRKAR